MSTFGLLDKIEVTAKILSDEDCGLSGPVHSTSPHLCFFQQPCRKHTIFIEHWPCSHNLPLTPMCRQLATANTCANFPAAIATSPQRRDEFFSTISTPEPWSTSCKNSRWASSILHDNCSSGALNQMDSFFALNQSFAKRSLFGYFSSLLPDSFYIMLPAVEQPQSILSLTPLIILQRPGLVSISSSLSAITHIRMALKKFQSKLYYTEKEQQKSL